MTLEGEIKDAKKASFSSYFQTLIKNSLRLGFLYEVLMNLRREVCTERDLKTKLILPKTDALFPFFFMLPRFFELCVHICVSMLFGSDAPLSFNPLVVAELGRGDTSNVTVN